MPRAALIKLSAMVALVPLAQVHFMSCVNTQGDVTIGTGCRVDPSAQIVARRGPIKIAINNVINAGARIENNTPEPLIIGSNNVFGRDARAIANRGPIQFGDNNMIAASASLENNKPGPQVILHNNVLKTGAHCESQMVGNNNVLGPGSWVGSNLVITDNCVVGQNCRLEPTSYQKLAQNQTVPSCGS